jgi:hypothetical protein
MISYTTHVLFLVNFLIVGCGYFFMIRSGYVFSILCLGLLLYLGIGYMDIDNSRNIFGEYTIKSTLFFTALASFLLFSAFLAFSSIIAGGGETAKGLSPMPFADLRDCSWLKPVFLALLAASIISLVLLHGVNTFQETWEERRVLDSKFAIMPALLGKTLAIFPGIFLLARQRIWTVLSLVIAVLLPILLGARLIMVIAIASLYLALLVKHGTRPWVRLLPLLALPLALSLHTFLRLTRGIELFDLIDGSVIDVLLEQSSLGIDWFGGERTPFRGLLYVVESEIWKSIPGVFQTIHRILFFWLPHEIVDKPADVVEWIWRRSLEDGYMGYIVSTDYGSDMERLEAYSRAIKDGSIHCTLWGEILANGGYLAAVPVIFFLAFVFAVEEVVATSLSPVMRYGFVTVMIAQYLYISRGSTVDPFTALMFITPVWGATVMLMGLPIFDRSRMVANT